MVKKLLLPICLLLPFFLKSQNLLILDSGTVVNGQTLTYYGNSTDSLLKFHLGVKNLFTDSLDVKMRRTEIGKLTGTQNYFCWSICYTPVNSGIKPTWTDIGTVKMKPDSIYENFTAYFIPNGVSGIAGFHYVLYDVNNPDDSAYVDLVFDITTGIADQKVSSAGLSYYPNPVNDMLTIERNQTTGNYSTVVITNLLGEIIESLDFQHFEKAKKINTVHYAPGIYFYCIRQNSTAISTEKFIVMH